MAFTKLTNIGQAPLTLPSPFRGVLGRGASIVLRATVAELESALVGFEAAMKLTALPDGQAATPDDSYAASSPASSLIVDDAILGPVDEIVPVDTTTEAIDLYLPDDPPPNCQKLILKVNAGTNGINLTRKAGVLINGVDGTLALPSSTVASIGRWHAVFVSSTIGWMVG